MSEWKKTSCVLCFCNCGLEVQTEGSRLAPARHRDRFAATPLHRHIPCRISRA